MNRPFSLRPLVATVALLWPLVGSADDPMPDPAGSGTVPTDEAGRPLNLDFETGTLADWTAEGEAFAKQPIEGDTVHARRSDMHSGHAGRFWIGTFEVGGDAPTGTLTSAPFRVTKPFASFLVAGGPHATTRVELVETVGDQVIARVSGDESEDLKRVVVDLTPQRGREVYIRLVDGHGGHWGHLNFDDFRLHDSRPVVPARPTVSAPDEFAHAGLAPEEAARAMTVPDGFKVTLFAGEPDVIQPIAMTLDDRGRVWVAEAYSYPKRVPDDQAKDRIVIFEDQDGDGRFDRRTVFAEGLNLVSGLEVGFGGAWVGAAPHLLFIPDQDGDDRPDGPPQVVLDGWAMQDTHETLNSFIWGPDGWLYGCHGVFTHSNVGTPGTPDRARTPINAGIWRYHPTTRVFEVFAHGTSNPWGVDFDDRGQCVLTACVIPHLYHIVQGGRFERQAGQHFNQYTYDDIKTIADHRHYVGANPHGGNGRSDSAGGGHAHAGAMIYLGDAWPEEYRGSIFMNNIHGARLNRDTLSPRGSGLVGGHSPDFLLANDAWSQLLYFRTGPDGNVYMIDWYDKNQCHRNETDAHDRTNGRIFKVSYGASPTGRFAVTDRDGHPHRSLRDLGDLELADLLSRSNAWFARHARRILQERAATRDGGPDAGVRAGLARMFEAHPDEVYRLRLLWAIHAYGGLDEPLIARGLDDASPHVRAWTIQLATEGKAPSDATLARFAALAQTDPSPVVRLYLASAMQRLPVERRWDVVAGLVGHGEDDGDHNLPLMVWYAAEPLAEADPSRALALASESSIAILPTFMARRIGAIGTPGAIALLVDRLGRSEPSEARRAILTGMNEALKGRRRVERPGGWVRVYKALSADPDPEVRSQATTLGVTFGDPTALEAMRTALTTATRPPEARREALAALLKARDPKLVPILQALVADDDLRGDALRGLAAFDDPKTPGVILGAYGSLPPAERRDALNTLASRPAFAGPLLDAVAAKEVAASDLSADLIRQLRNLKDDALNRRIAEVWGAVRETSEDKASMIARAKAMLTRGYAPRGDVHLGRAIFARTCGQCHVLFGSGGTVGPELTGSNRADLDYVLRNVLDPNELIGKDYLAHVVAMSDGRVLTGIIRQEDDTSITLVTANETLVLPKADIEERKVSDQSMMPEDQWANLSEHEIRSLVAYLAGPNQVPMLATPENVESFFNGKDLSGWEGDPALWSVEQGEIVGKTSGLARNEFLRGSMLASDFRLTVKVKLVANEGNSGIQFRSESLPEGEVKGYQADIGKDWWGKLYEENGRGLLWEESGESFVKPGDWNEYEVVAVGDTIRTKINGHPCVDLDDPPGAKRGIFAFQLHAGGPTEVRFKDIKLELNPAQP